MAWHRAIVEVLMVSGSIFMLFSIALILGMLLLMLLILCFAISGVRRLEARNLFRLRA